MKIVLGPLMFTISLINYCIYSLFGYQSNFSYRIFRKTYVFTNGIFNDFVSFVLKSFKKAFTKSEINSLNSLIPSVLSEKDSFTDSMDANGYYIFKSKVDHTILNNLSNELNAMPLISLKNGESYNINRIDMLPEGKSLRQKKDLLKSKPVLNFVFCKEFIYLAQTYLGSMPICNNLASWVTKPSLDENMLNLGAQKFHFDMDKIKFIKFFIYLTDVDTNNGPHIYISSSHKKLPNALQSDGRYDDKMISKIYKKEEIVEIKGQRGTLIAVDTRGLHKGKPLAKNYRDVLQVEYSNSLFGRKYITQLEQVDKLNKIETAILQ
jgi:hypothetical protein